MGKFDDKTTDEAPERVSKMCNMHDCSLTGTLSDNTRGAGPWWCVYHFHTRFTLGLTPEEKRELRDIADEYGAGRRDYGAGILETRNEMLNRIKNEK